MASYSSYGRRVVAASFDELASVEFAERILGPADNMLQFDLELNSSVRDRLPYMLGRLRTGLTLALFASYFYKTYVNCFCRTITFSNIIFSMFRLFLDTHPVMELECEKHITTGA